MEFVKKEAQRVLSYYMSASNWKHSKNSAELVPKVNTHSTAVSNNYEKCSFCFGRQVLWDCFSFARKGLNARLQFMRKNHLCDNRDKQSTFQSFAMTKVDVVKLHFETLHVIAL